MIIEINDDDGDDDDNNKTIAYDDRLAMFCDFCEGNAQQHNKARRRTRKCKSFPLRLVVSFLFLLVVLQPKHEIYVYASRHARI